eukprot:m.20237 g.20237  ORF g.20237 m.20237 type:complete len:158 (+) comp6117_c0_seq1:308-781(+)
MSKFAKPRAHNFYLENCLAFDFLARACCCYPCVRLGLRTNHPADSWYIPAEIRGLYVPAAGDDAGEHRLSSDVVSQQLVAQGGTESWCCPGLMDCCEPYPLVHEVHVDRSDGHLTLLVHPNYVDRVVDTLKGTLSTPVGAHIEITGKPIVTQPTGNV